MFIGFIAMLLSGFISVWPSYILKIVIDIVASGKLLDSQLSLDLIPKQLINYGVHPISISIRPREITYWIPVIFIGIFLLDGVLRFTQIFNTRFFGVLVSNELREKGHEKILGLDLSQIRGRNSGDLISCLTNDLNLVQSLTAEALTALVNDSARAIALSIWLLMIDWKLSLVGVLIIPIFFLAVSKLSKKLRKFANQGQQATAKLSSFISETVQGIDLVHLFNIKEKRHEKFKEKSGEFVNVWKKQLLTDASISPFIGVVSSVGIGLVMWIGLNRIFSGEVSIGDFSSYLVATLLLYQPLKRLFRVNAQINQIIGTCQRLFDLIDTQTKIKSDFNINFNTGKSKFSIDFNNVSFSYSNKLPVLQNINLKISEGEQISIVGSSGSGKSSLLCLIPRLYDVTDGELIIKDGNVKKWDLRELRKSVSFVTQDPFLFSGSIKDNLLLVKPDASEVEINKALELAKVDFLNSVEGGLNGQIGERGLNLSGGQRQRISIARAFLKDSPILILDEPTSALDQQSEELIRQSIQELVRNRTVVTVTHKLSSIKDCPRIICMNQGKIVEDGSHGELIDKQGQYYQLVESA